MPTPICQEYDSEFYGEYCICSFCDNINNCPLARNQNRCAYCEGPIEDCEHCDMEKFMDIYSSFTSGTGE
jgi:hypothetical protein